MSKVLVVNNDIDIMDLIQKWLERKGNVKVKYTGDEDEVPHLVKKFQPDVVLIDILKAEAAKKIKEDKELKPIPVIIMTGYTITTPANCLEIADDVIEKPFDPKVLEQKVGKFLKKTG